MGYREGDVVKDVEGDKELVAKVCDSNADKGGKYSLSFCFVLCVQGGFVYSGQLAAATD